MGADRAVLISDDAAAGSDLVATSYALAKALEREGADVVLFGQQAGDSTARCSGRRSPTGCACPSCRRLRRSRTPTASCTVKRQTEFGYDVIEAAASRSGRRVRRDQRTALPVAQGNHGCEVEAAGDGDARGSRRRSGPCRRAGLAHRGVRAQRSAARAATRRRSTTTATLRRRSSTSLRRSASYEHARLPRAPRRRASEGLARRACESRDRSATATSPES